MARATVCELTQGSPTALGRAFAQIDQVAAPSARAIKVMALMDASGILERKELILGKNLIA